MSVLHLIRHWFILQGTVSREEYAITGFCLMLLKYAVEAVTISFTTGKFYSLFDFFNPLLSARSQFAIGAPEWLGMAWVLWTIPYVWIAVTMSIRRAVDAGASPWAGMLVLVPVFNFLIMLYLAAIPTGYANRGYDPRVIENDRESDKSVFQVAQVLKAAIVSIAVGFFYFFSLTLISINVFHAYGSALFFGAPIVTGAACAYMLNRSLKRTVKATLGHCVLVVVFFSAFLLIFGLEGGLCIAMALPIVLPAALLGALIGRAIATDRYVGRVRKDKGYLSCLIVMPILIVGESYFWPQAEFVVLTSIDIDASSQKVWQSVVSFPLIAERPEWFFRWGISCPLGAHIDGSDVGATRYCDFTTGSFEEPVTTWDAPRVLAFNVTDQPDPMTELSPYRHIHPPHLDGSFRSTRGEFRLVPLADGGTRLEGRTWYELEIYPHAYWTLWTDWLLHRIHGRVLRHIKQLAEVKELAGQDNDGNGRIGL